ncbi:MAG: hypothetical protein ACHQD9_09105 [Chitinophagales bacterium]
MKSKSYTVSLFILLIGFASCNSSDISAPNMPEVRFTHLNAGRYSISVSDTTHLHATVVHQCKLIQFSWASSDGDLVGGANDMTFTAPSSPGTVILTCTVTHPGRIPETRIVTINVNPKSAPTSSDQQKKIGTPRL